MKCQSGDPTFSPSDDVTGIATVPITIMDDAGKTIEQFDFSGSFNLAEQGIIPVIASQVKDAAPRRMKQIALRATQAKKLESLKAAIQAKLDTIGA